MSVTSGWIPSRELLLRCGGSRTGIAPPSRSLPNACARCAIAVQRHTRSPFGRRFHDLRRQTSHTRPEGEPNPTFHCRIHESIRGEFMALGVRSRLYLSLTLGLLAVSSVAAQRGASFPRLADGKPNLQGIWQSDGKPAADIQPFVEGGTLPYKPGATAKKQSNFRDRAKEDPLNNCFMPGVPRIMYLEYPFQIFQAKDHLVFTFEWSSVFRLIYTTAKASPHAGVDSWMGDSRGRWEGDTLVVEVIGSNDRAWLDAAGNYHSDKMRVTERYTMTD